MAVYYALRYQAHVPLKARKHAASLGRFDEYDDASTVLSQRDPSGALLEVVVRGDV